MLPTPEFEAAGLRGRVSSVRLECGDRAAQVMVSEGHETSYAIGDWYDNAEGRPLACGPNETAEFNLHQLAPLLADGVDSAYLVSHAVDAVTAPFSWPFEAAWAAGLEQLPSEASADGELELRLASATSFTLRQNLTLDHLVCTERSAHVALRTHLFPDGHFDVNVSSTYVDTGFGDLWGCNDTMSEILADAAVSLTVQLEASLGVLVPGSDGPYYFVPEWNLREFLIVGTN